MTLGPKGLCTSDVNKWLPFINSLQSCWIVWCSGSLLLIEGVNCLLPFGRKERTEEAGGSK